MLSDGGFLSELRKSENLVKESEKKIIVLLRAVGNAPVLNQPKFNISGTTRMAGLYDYLKKLLKSTVGDNDSLFLYVNNNFSPSLNAFLIDLYNNYAVGGQLIISYALTEAWG